MLMLNEKFNEIIWKADINTMPWWQAWPLSVLRFVHIMIIDFLDGQLNLRAMSLVFTTVLSIVPVIAVSFTVAKAFGMHNHMEPLLLNYLAPLGEQGKEIAQQIMGFVDNIKVGILGGIGLALLFLIIIRLIQKIEFAFNYTWRVKHTGSLVRRIGNYLIVSIIGPLLVFVALAVTGSAMNSSVAQAIISIEPFGTLLSIGAKLVPYLLIIAAFTFTYLFIPNAKVRVIPALTGGITAGILWQTVGWMFATVFSASITTSYTAIYSSFAFLFVFMIWLWWSWLILLVGSSVAFYRQYPEYLFINTHEMSLSNKQKEELALKLMAVIGQRFYNDSPPVSVNDMVEILHLPKQSIEHQLQLFEAHGLLLKTDADEPTYAPARPLEELSLKTVIDTVREPGPNDHIKSTLTQFLPNINSLLGVIDKELSQVLGNTTIKEIIKQQGNDSDEYMDNAVTPIATGRKNKNE